MNMNMHMNMNNVNDWILLLLWLLLLLLLYEKYNELYIVKYKSNDMRYNDLDILSYIINN